MGERIIHPRKGFIPLPIRDGLNPTRARVPVPDLTAWDFVWHLISTQRHRHPDDDEAALQRRFDAGEIVLRDGTVLRPDSPLKLGHDVYFYRMPAPETPVPYKIRIVYEDQDILIADKPPFMATMPRARHITETATVRLRRLTGNSDLTPAHRLDRLTSGLLLFTKRREIRGAYQTLFARREVHKTYRAIAPIKDFETPLVWSNRMEKVPGHIQGSIVDAAPSEHNAVTLLRSVDRLSHEEEASLNLTHGPRPPLASYTLEPATGKTHQLRLHMLAAGVPILGDPVYPVIFPEDAEDFSVPLRLRAEVLSFRDPLSGAKREFMAPPGFDTYGI